MVTLSREQVERLDGLLEQEPTYRQLHLESLRSSADISSVARYQLGDLVRVRRSGGGWSLGVATREFSEGHLPVLVRSQGEGSLSVKRLGESAVIRSNPLKIGDYIQIDGTPFWVAGIDLEGQLQVLSRGGQRIDPHEFRARIVKLIEGFSDSDKTVQFSNEDRTQLIDANQPKADHRPISMARPISPGPYVPIESILRANSVYGLYAGNKETDTVYNLRSPLAGAALHTSRGHNYKSFNEDGGALFADASGRIYLGVFDQAGGEGSDDQALGAASAIAADMLFDEMRAIAEEGGDHSEGEEAMVRAATRAHHAILSRGRGEVTTFVAAMIDEMDATIVNVGDSGAMHFAKNGRHLRSTAQQGVGRLLLEGLGMVRKRKFAHQTYHWPVRPGDLLVFGTDGLYDARLEPKEIGSLIASTQNAADATRRLRDIVSRRMKSKTAKPDNLTVLVVRVGERDRSESNTKDYDTVLDVLVPSE